jgi:hypothetical protein
VLNGISALIGAKEFVHSSTVRRSQKAPSTKHKMDPHQIPSVP